VKLSAVRNSKGNLVGRSSIFLFICGGLMAMCSIAQADPVYTYNIPTGPVYYYYPPTGGDSGSGSGGNSNPSTSGSCSPGGAGVCYYTVYSPAPVSPTPEPGSAGLVLTAMAAVGLVLKARRNRKAAVER
jgi:hypothetical protein